MAFYHVDTSAVVKRYVAETGSAWLRALLAPASGKVISLAEVTRAEVASAMARRVREYSLTSSERDDLMRAFSSHCVTEYELVPTDNTIVDLAVDLLRIHPLRAYDAIQLAAAITVNRSAANRGLQPIVFISADDTLIATAQAEGLPVDNPNWHP